MNSKSLLSLPRPPSRPAYELPCSNAGVDAGVGFSPAHEGTIARSSDHVLLIDQRDRQRAGTLFETFEQTLDIADPIGCARRPAALEFKGPRVRPLAFRVVADQLVRDAPFEQHVARDAG